MAHIKHTSMTLSWSLHAAQRQQQRGFKASDVELVMTWGEDVEDGFVLSDRALKRARKELGKAGEKAALQRLERIRGMTLIEQGNTLVTIYRADRKRLRRLRSGHVQTGQAA